MQLYNGYYHGTTTCNNVFAFSSERDVCCKYAGAWHDAQVSQGLINTVIEYIGIYALSVNQAFLRSEIVLSGHFQSSDEGVFLRRFSSAMEDSYFAT